MSIYIGIDWSETKHDAAFLNEAGAVLAQLVFPHSAAGFRQLEATCQRLGLLPGDCLLGLETAHNLLIDFLWSRGFSQLHVVPPNVVKSSRGRYRQSGARSDPSDARLLADLLRTDRAHLQPWHPDTLLTRQLRARVSAINFLTQSIRRVSNRLRALLLRYYPVALDIFSDLTTQTLLEFLRTYPTPQVAAALTFAEFQAFARSHHYTQPQNLATYYGRLQQPQPTASLETVTVFQEEAVQLATLLLNLVQSKAKLVSELNKLFQQHPDAASFASLPGAGDFLAPALLAHFGDDRQRFPTAASIQALAGTCPITDSSGKGKLIRFRRACNHEFRQIAHQWARRSCPESVWAMAYWTQVRSRSHSDNHAYRCLANRWLGIAWKLWQTHQVYDEAYHLKQRALRSQSHT